MGNNTEPTLWEKRLREKDLEENMRVMTPDGQARGVIKETRLKVNDIGEFKVLWDGTEHPISYEPHDIILVPEEDQPEIQA